VIYLKDEAAENSGIAEEQIAVTPISSAVTVNANQRIADNLARVRERIADAARASGRGPDDVTLVAVTKYVGVAEVEALLGAGCRDLGESRPQDLWEKAAAVPSSDVRWHMVGHLQRNKVRRTLPLVHLIHSADSRRLLNTLNKEASGIGDIVKVLLEVNISGDAEKHGFTPEEMPGVLGDLNQWPSVDVTGLMAMASRTGGTDVARQNFAALRELRDQLQAESSAALPELSMGMSGDYEAGIQEGATIVRVGSALFEKYG